MKAVPNTKFKTVEEYFSTLSANEKAILGELRKTIKQVAPKAEQLISYNMPSFKLNGMLVWYAIYKNHIGFYPSASPIRIFKNELTGYKTSKGAIQFPIDKAFPKGLVKKIVKFRINENMEKQKAKEKR